MVAVLATAAAVVVAAAVAAVTNRKLTNIMLLQQKTDSGVSIPEPVFFLLVISKTELSELFLHPHPC